MTITASVWRVWWMVGDTTCQRYFSTSEVAAEFSSIVRDNCLQLGIDIRPSVDEVQVFTSNS